MLLRACSLVSGEGATQGATQARRDCQFRAASAWEWRTLQTLRQTTHLTEGRGECSAEGWSLPLVPRVVARTRPITTLGAAAGEQRRQRGAEEGLQPPEAASVGLEDTSAAVVLAWISPSQGTVSGTGRSQQGRLFTAIMAPLLSLPHHAAPLCCTAVAPFCCPRTLVPPVLSLTSDFMRAHVLHALNLSAAQSCRSCWHLCFRSTAQVRAVVCHELAERSRVRVRE